MKSNKFELNNKDLEKIIRQTLIIFTPVILLFLEQLQRWELDYKILVALWISVIIDVLRRFITDYTE